MRTGGVWVYTPPPPSTTPRRKKRKKTRRRACHTPPRCTRRGNEPRRRGRNRGSPLPPRRSRKPWGTSSSPPLHILPALLHILPPRSRSGLLIPNILHVVRLGDVALLGSSGAGNVALLGASLQSLAAGDVAVTWRRWGGVEGESRGVTWRG